MAWRYFDSLIQPPAYPDRLRDAIPGPRRGRGLVTVAAAFSGTMHASGDDITTARMLTLQTPTTHSVEIKKSRFVAHAARTDRAEAARAFIDRGSRPDASHNCWAYRIGSEYRFSDDGEPAGTAGRPIYSAIEGRGLDHVAVVVARYFGGTKLGAGGLVRAYGGCAAECLDRAAAIEVEPLVSLELRAGFDALGLIHTLLERFGAAHGPERYDADGVRLKIEVAGSKVAALAAALRDGSSGQAKLRDETGATL